MESTVAQPGAPTVRTVPAVLVEVIAWMLIVSGTCASGCSWWAMRAQRER